MSVVLHYQHPENYMVFGLAHVTGTTVQPRLMRRKDGDDFGTIANGFALTSGGGGNNGQVVERYNTVPGHETITIAGDAGSGELGSGKLGSSVNNPLVPAGPEPVNGPVYATWCGYLCLDDPAYCASNPCGGSDGGPLSPPPPSCGPGETAVGGQCVGGAGGGGGGGVGSGPIGSPAGPCPPGYVNWGELGCLPKDVSPTSLFPDPQQGKNRGSCSDCNKSCNKQNSEGEKKPFGLTRCENGQPCSCVCGANIQGAWPNGPADMVGDCVEKHEMLHLANAQARPGRPGGCGPNGLRRDRDGENEECEAQVLSIDCACSDQTLRKCFDLPRTQGTACLRMLGGYVKTRTCQPGYYEAGKDNEGEPVYEPNASCPKNQSDLCRAKRKTCSDKLDQLIMDAENNKKPWPPPATSSQP